MEYVVVLAIVATLLATAITSELRNDVIVEQFERHHGVVICLDVKEYQQYRYHRPNTSCMTLEYQRTIFRRSTDTLLFTTPKALTEAPIDLQRRVLVTAAKQRGVNPYRVVSFGIAT